MYPLARPSVSDLRRTLTALHPAPGSRQPLGVSDIDAVLSGGLLLGALHELCPARSLDLGAASGFAAVLATRGHNGGPSDGRQMLWLQQDFAGMEGGGIYGAVDDFGLPLTSLLLVQVPRVIDVLWAMEEALKCRAVAAVVAEIAEDGSVDLTATRRLSLAAREGGGLGLLLRHRPAATAKSFSTLSAAATRWDIAAAASERDAFGGLGRTTFALSLVRNRCGPCGRWITSWDHHERAFVSPTLSRGVAQPARDRSARALSVRAA